MAECRKVAIRGALGHDASTGSHVATDPPMHRSRVRAPIRELSRRDAPPVQLPQMRKVRTKDFVDVGRDATLALLCQIREAIGDPNSVTDMLEAWNEGTISFKYGDKYALLNKMLEFKELSLALKYAASAAKSLAELESE